MVASHQPPTTSHQPPAGVRLHWPRYGGRRGVIRDRNRGMTAQIVQDERQSRGDDR